MRQAYLCGAESVREYQAEKGALTRQYEALCQQEQSPGEDFLARLEQAEQTLADPQAETWDRYRAARAVLESCTWDRAARQVTLIYRFSL